MEKLSINEIKEIELNILKHVKKTCIENKLEYFLAGGTLLGAVRQEGFIPWDDDIDISMPREDYIKLLTILENGERYRSLSQSRDDYFYSFAKIVDLNTEVQELNVDYSFKNSGVWVDVFPIDGLPDDDKNIGRHLKKVLLYRQLLYNSLMKKCPGSLTKIKHIFRYAFWRVSRMFGWKYWINKVGKLAVKYKYNESNKASCVVYGYGKVEVFDKEVFKFGSEKKFEDDLYSVPADYDKCLKSMFGNYMELPPEGKRITHHKFQAWKIK